MSSDHEVQVGRVKFRPEIQGVRAIAVVAVLVFHIWPDILPGGYIGVDVFFVVSGFLITGLLLREVERNGRISLLGFYAKRIKRLLPAATVVLLAVATCISILPVLRWKDTANEIAASALYFENWWLAAKAVDYLAADTPPSPLQHFWSLSVEEQYYLVWPLIFAALVWIGLLRRVSTKRAFAIVVVVSGVASLCYSVYITPRNPGLAYFATTTRAWELALGAGLAVFTGWQVLSERVRQLLGIVGLAMIAIAALSFNSETVFPGYAAVLPTVGAGFLVVSGASRRSWSLYGLLSSRPAQYVGDLSYSLYLWHWPVVVFYREIAGREIGLVDGVIILVVSLALAHQTKSLVEDPFRGRDVFSQAKWRPFGFAGACIALSVVCWAAISHQADMFRNQARAPVQETASLVYPGALSRTHGVRAPSAVPYVPDVLSARDDKGDPYRDGCIASLRSDKVRECVYGAEDAARHVLIVGDSHAVHWVPALQVIAEHESVRITAITKSACALVDIPLQGIDLDQYRSCIAWSRKAIQRIAELRPDAVLFAHSRSSLSRVRETREESALVIANSLRETWAEFEALGITLFALADTPSFSSDVPDCLAGASREGETCARSRGQATARIDPLVIAAQGYPDVRLLDYADAFCSDSVCEPVIGNVLAWRDAHHMTATFARTLAPALSRDIAPIVGELSPEDVGAYDQVSSGGRRPSRRAM